MQGASVRIMDDDFPNPEVEVERRHLLEIANQLATGNTVFAANAAVEFGQLAATERGILLLLSQPAADVAARHLGVRLHAAALPGALRDEVQAAGAAAGAVAIIARNPQGAKWLLNPHRDLTSGGPGVETAVAGIFEGLAGLLQYDTQAVGEAVNALSSLANCPASFDQLSQLPDVLFRSVVAGMVSALFNQPEDKSLLATETLCTMFNSMVVRRRLLRISAWDRVLLGELTDLLKTHARKHAMTVLCAIVAQEDFRHQLMTRIDSFQPLVAELILMLEHGHDSLPHACAVFCGFAADELS
ncbi:hypothetical protein CYMTET_18592, partial [Cymbomonas tetramitiformis]